MVNKIWFMFPIARDGLYFQEFTESTFHQSWLNIATGTIKEMRRNFLGGFQCIKHCTKNEFFHLGFLQ